MAVDNAPPLIVIGMEGLWGSIIMLLVFPVAAAIPGRDLGCIENTADSFYMVSQSGAIQVRIFGIFGILNFWNFWNFGILGQLEIFLNDICFFFS